VNASLQEENDTSSSYKCDLCDYKAPAKYQLLYHISFRHPIDEHPKLVPLFKCRDCEFETLKAWEMDAHNNFKHGRNETKCDSCDYKSAFANYVAEHALLAHPIAEVKASSSSAPPLPDQGNSISFVASLRNEREEKKCKECSFVGDSNDSLARHVVSEHIKICPLCKYDSPKKCQGHNISISSSNALFLTDNQCLFSLFFVWTKPISRRKLHVRKKLKTFFHPF
jgi:hypothetical protein